MNYVDLTFYNDLAGENMTEKTFSSLVDIASRIIDEKTLFKTYHFNEFPDVIKTAVKKATAFQIQKMNQDGGVKSLNKGNYTSESIGSYSYQKASKSEQKLETINGIEVSPLVDVYLLPTGLLNRGLNKCFRTQ